MNLNACSSITLKYVVGIKWIKFPSICKCSKLKVDLFSSFIETNYTMTKQFGFNLNLRLTIFVIYLSTINDSFCGWDAIISSGKLNCPIEYNILSLKFEFTITSMGRVVNTNPNENIN
jgi:hypothetical protein